MFTGPFIVVFFGMNHGAPRPRPEKQPQTIVVGACLTIETTVLVLELQRVSIAIEVDNNVGFFTAARYIFRSLPAVVTRIRPDRFLRVELCFSL